MVLPNSLHNLKCHFSSVVKHKGCKEKFSAWTKDRELVQPTLESVVTGEVRKLSSAVVPNLFQKMSGYYPPKLCFDIIPPEHDNRIFSYWYK